jgi:hypothetical protein
MKQSASVGYSLDEFLPNLVGKLDYRDVAYTEAKAHFENSASLPHMFQPLVGLAAILGLFDVRA